MITCPVCGKQNDDLARLCTSCKSFLQSKVDNLNLFSTVWGLIESPSTTFKRIVLSQHKNYVLLLSSLLGICLLYTIFWYKNLGYVFPNLLMLIGAGLVVGPPFGVIFAAGFSFVLLQIARMFGGRATFLNSLSVVAYAAVPLVFALIFVFPIELAAFGLDFFGRNPHPMVIKPVVYVLLIGMDALAFLLSWLLLIEGTIVANGLTRRKTGWATFLVMVLTGISAFVLYFL